MTQPKETLPFHQFEIQITLHVRAQTANQAWQTAQSVMDDGRKNHTTAYIHYIDDVVALTETKDGEKS